MDLASNAWQAFSAVFVFLLGVFFSISVSRYFSVGERRGLFLYIWHTGFCLVYFAYLQSNVGDALMYYSASLADELRPFRVGTAAVIYFTSLFSKIFGFSFLGVFLVNNIIGFVGLLAFYGALGSVTRMKGKWLRFMALIIVLLPSISFWSSAIGKDSISFMAVGLALWAALSLQRRMGLMIFAVLAIFFVRPHMAGMMVLALCIAFVLHGNVSTIMRMLAGVISLAVAAFLIPFALQYAGVGEASDIDALMSFVEERQGYNQQGGGGVDIASMSPPMQLFTYMFRPLIFEARSIFQLAAAIDNIILMILFLAGGMAIWKGRKSPVHDSRIFLWVYALLAWIVLSLTTANLGIAMRQKWMFAPMLIYLMISVMGKARSARSISRTLPGLKNPAVEAAPIPTENKVNNA